MVDQVSAWRSPGPAIVPVIIRDAAYMTVYNPELGERISVMNNLNVFSFYARREWRLLSLAAFCGVGLTLGFLTLQSSGPAVPESRVISTPVASPSAASRASVMTAAPATIEYQRLAIRNRRLEALVQVLRNRSQGEQAGSENKLRASR